jgi:Rad3-related DNA helicase
MIKVNIKQEKFGYEVVFICLTPSLTISDLLNINPRSIILTSGTLTPIDTW